MRIRHNQIMYAAAAVLLLALAALGLLWSTMDPGNNKDWSPDQSVLPHAEIDGSLVRIRNIRNFTYITTDRYIPAYYDKTFDVNRLERMDFIVEPYSRWKGAAHTFASFAFDDGEYVAISVEIRRESGERFSALKGLFRQFEIMYVIGDESDLVKLRANYRKDPVYLYQINISRDDARKVFVSMIERTNQLYEEPEFYNTFLSTCTTNIVRHINEVMPGRIPFSWKLLTPGLSDQYLMEIGLIEADSSFEDMRNSHRINQRAAEYADDAEFSKRIRE